MSRESDCKLLAERIADDLFMNGSREHAQRLVLTVDQPKHRDLGGLSKGVVVDRVVKVLKGARIRPRREDVDEPT